MGISLTISVLDDDKDCEFAIHRQGDGIAPASPPIDRAAEEVFRIHRAVRVTVSQEGRHCNIGFFQSAPIVNCQMRAISVISVRQQKALV
jgi:hypothetical protein